VRKMELAGRYYNRLATMRELLPHGA